MLSIRNLVFSKQAAIYFAKDDYYHGSTQHQPSAWWGRGSRMLGLEGAVGREAFEAALEGNLPNGRSLPRNAGGERRPGFDLTFSAPKSVSLLALVHGSKDVVLAHENAVSEALGFIENEAAVARTTSAGVALGEPTNNLLVARFSHDTSRDLDPQLHSHCVVINATRRKDGEWRSISNERIYALKMLGGAIYRARLAV
jgi:conjugative relaxase-like TrwC/TraI family protein